MDIVDLLLIIMINNDNDNDDNYKFNQSSSLTKKSSSSRQSSISSSGNKIWNIFKTKKSSTNVDTIANNTTNISPRSSIFSLERRSTTNLNNQKNVNNNNDVNLNNNNYKNSFSHDHIFNSPKSMDIVLPGETFKSSSDSKDFESEETLEPKSNDVSDNDDNINIINGNSKTYIPLYTQGESHVDIDSIIKEDIKKSNNIEYVNQNINDHIRKISPNSSFSKYDISYKQMNNHHSYSKKAENNMHKLFPASKGETYLGHYRCAYQKDILLHGKLYITTGRIYFWSNILGYTTQLAISIKDILTVNRKSILKFPSAIEIRTASEKYIFASLLKRDEAYYKLKSLLANDDDNSSFTINNNATFDIKPSYIPLPTDSMFPKETISTAPILELHHNEYTNYFDYEKEKSSKRNIDMIHKAEPPNNKVIIGKRRILHHSKPRPNSSHSSSHRHSKSLDLHLVSLRIWILYLCVGALLCGAVVCSVVLARL